MARFFIWDPSSVTRRVKNESERLRMNADTEHHRLQFATGTALTLMLSVFITTGGAYAAIIGTNVPVPPLSEDRIAKLPSDAQKAWKEYLEHSKVQRAHDLEIFRREMRAHGLTNSLVPPSGHAAHSLPLDNRSVWYASAEARGLADHVVSFQTPAGGWSKNLNLASHARRPGELFGPENGSQHLSPADFDAPLDGVWNYVGTIDNDATTTEMQFLARVIAAVGERQSSEYKASFSRGLDYLLAAQFPNGGWPQVWPLQGGYHDAITINDGAMLEVLELLRNIGEGTDDFEFVSAQERTRARTSFQRGLKCLLNLQVVMNGRRTIWCQQYEALTLQPASARNYEMPSLATGESGNIVLYLMTLTDPEPAVVSAVYAATAWFEKNKMMDVAFKSTGKDGRHLVSAPGNGPIWARYYEISDDRPIFGDRDKSIHDTVDEISYERRKGYSWYTDSGKRALQHCVRWKKLHPLGE